MDTEEIISTLKELSEEHEFFKITWDWLQRKKIEDKEAYDAFIDDIIFSDVTDKQSLAEYLLRM